MSEQTYFPVDVLSSTGQVWIGASGGRAAQPLLAATLRSEVAQKTPLIVIDFSGLQILTASAVRTGLFPVLEELNDCGKHGVLVGLNEAMEDEVHLAAEAGKRALTSATLSDGLLCSGHVLGVLDDKLRETLEHVVALDEADAKAVSHRSGDQTVVTVWNNRLTALQSLGLLTERKVGRTKLYRPVLKGMTYGR